MSRAEQAVRFLMVVVSAAFLGIEVCIGQWLPVAVLTLSIIVQGWLWDFTVANYKRREVGK